MAEKDDKTGKSAKGSKGEKPEKADKAQRAEGGGKGKQAQPAGKGQPQKGDKAPKAEAVEKKPRGPQERVIPRLRTHFDEVVRKRLTEERGYKNKMEVPQLQKIALNRGIGGAVNDPKKAEAAAADLGLIAGQKAVITKARKSIATFKVRDGQPIGCKVTLRKTRMYEVLDRLVNQ